MKMGQRNKKTKTYRRILLLLDNCTAHLNLQNLQNIDLKFLPPNTTSLIQPLDQGIIKTMNTNYRQAMQNFIVETIDVYEIPASQIILCIINYYICDYMYMYIKKLQLFDRIIWLIESK